MKFLVQLFLLSVLCIGLSSCEDDQDVVTILFSATTILSAVFQPIK